MNHLGTRTLRTRRLTLRRFADTDAERMFENWAKDPDVTRYLAWAPYENVEGVRAFVKKMIEEYKDSSSYQWIIELDEINEPIGSIGVCNIGEKTPRCEIGYVIGKRWWGQGIVAEALEAVLAFLFDDVGFECVCACHDPNNPNSGRVMRKCGMSYEGTLRHSHKNNIGISDAAYYSILKSEWECR